VDVVDWRDTPWPVAPKVRASRGYWSPTLIGITGTLLIHSLIVPTAFMGSRAAKVRPPETQDSGTLLKSKADSTESLVLITLPTISSSSLAVSRNISSQFSPSKMVVPSPAELEPPAPLDIEILALDEEQAFQLNGDSAEGAEQVRLFGIYTGQIRARIERIWRRPRTPVNESVSGTPTAADDSFQCQVQIVQNANGFVQEVLLPRCNGSPAWQRSLVMAIQQASPLPAPPSSRIFSRSVALDFVGLPYVSGSPVDDYEGDSRSRRTAGAVEQTVVTEMDQFRGKATNGLGSSPNNLHSQN
jgi:TonB C terminal